MRPRGQTPRMRASDAVAGGRVDPRRFNEAAGADPADADNDVASAIPKLIASMRPRGQTPRMPAPAARRPRRPTGASMRPRGQTPRMRGTAVLPATSP